MSGESLYPFLYLGFDPESSTGFEQLILMFESTPDQESKAAIESGVPDLLGEGSDWESDIFVVDAGEILDHWEVEDEDLEDEIVEWLQQVHRTSPLKMVVKLVDRRFRSPANFGNWHVWSLERAQEVALELASPARRSWKWDLLVEIVEYLDAWQGFDKFDPRLMERYAEIDGFTANPILQQQYLREWYRGRRQTVKRKFRLDNPATIFWVLSVLAILLGLHIQNVAKVAYYEWEFDPHAGLTLVGPFENQSFDLSRICIWWPSEFEYPSRHCAIYVDEASNLNYSSFEVVRETSLPGGPYKNNCTVKEIEGYRLVACIWGVAYEEAVLSVSGTGEFIIAPEPPAGPLRRTASAGTGIFALGLGFTVSGIMAWRAAGTWISGPNPRADVVLATLMTLATISAVLTVLYADFFFASCCMFLIVASGFALRKVRTRMNSLRVWSAGLLLAMFLTLLLQPLVTLIFFGPSFASATVGRTIAQGVVLIGVLLLLALVPRLSTSRQLVGLEGLYDYEQSNSEE